MLKKIDGFILCLIIVLVGSFFMPSLNYNWLFTSIGNITTVGISLIFLFYGLKLSKTDITSGLKNYKLHIIVQLSTFVLFPLIAIALKPVFSLSGISSYWFSFFFLAALPSTVSSSVVMVSIAKGNIPAAIFNASVSGLLGVFITPLWLSSDTSIMHFLGILLDLFLQILLPVCIGVLLNKWWGHFARKHSKKLSLFDKTIILLIVYNSFSEAFYNNIFSNLSVVGLVTIALLSVLMLVLVYFLIWVTCSILKFSLEDKITASFCGSKKSLVHGTVMAKIMFKNSGSMATLLLPTMIYHSIQLIVISFVAQHFSKKNTIN